MCCVQEIDVDGGVFVCDYTSLKGLAVRQGFEKFGAAAYFDEDCRLIKIDWSNGNPNDGTSKVLFARSVNERRHSEQHLHSSHLLPRMVWEGCFSAEFDMGACEMGLEMLHGP